MPEKEHRVSQIVQKEYGISAPTVERLTSGVVNESWLVRDFSGEQFVFRIYAAGRDVSVIAFELEVLGELERHTFPSPRVRSTLSGALLSQFDGRPAVLTNFISGGLKQALSLQQLHDTGRMLGILHRTLRGFVPSARKSTWEPDALDHLYRAEREAFLVEGGAAAEEIVSLCDKYMHAFTFPNSLPKGVTHQDVKRENIIVRNEEVVGLIDFDNAYFGTLLHDLMTTCVWEAYEKDRLAPERLKAVVQGYSLERPLTEEERACMGEAFRHRLLREAFISPFAAVRDKDIAFVRARRFVERFNAFNAVEVGTISATLI